MLPILHTSQPLQLKVVAAGQNVLSILQCAFRGRAVATRVPVFCYIYISQGSQGTDRKNVRASGGISFIKQFVEKDLANVASLKNMRWVFDGKYGNAAKLKTDIINVLEKSGKSKLNNSGVLKLFDDYAESIGYAGSINNVDELISFMKADSGWFNMIFSLK